MGRTEDGTPRRVRHAGTSLLSRKKEQCVVPPLFHNFVRCAKRLLQATARSASWPQCCQNGLKPPSLSQVQRNRASISLHGETSLACAKLKVVVKEGSSSINKWPRRINVHVSCSSDKGNELVFRRQRVSNKWRRSSTHSFPDHNEPVSRHKILSKCSLATLILSPAKHSTTERRKQSHADNEKNALPHPPRKSHELISRI